MRPSDSQDVKTTARDQERASAPTIGLLLMIALTIVLVGSVGVQVLGGGGPPPAAPQAAFVFDFTQNGMDDELVIEHNVGDVIDGDQLMVVVEDADPEGDGSYRWNGSTLQGSPTVASSERVSLNESTIGDGSQLNLDWSTVKLVWRSDGKDSSFPIASWDGPVTNAPPQATFSHTRQGVSQIVNLDASASTDPDGSIATYEWDTDDDGTYERSGETVPNANVPPGTIVTLRVTDDGGVTATQAQTVP